MKNKQGVKIKIDDEAYYEVTLNKAVAFKGRILSPIAKNTMKGAILKTLPQEAVADVVATGNVNQEAVADVVATGNAEN